LGLESLWCRDSPARRIVLRNRKPFILEDNSITRILQKESCNTYIMYFFIIKICQSILTKQNSYLIIKTLTDRIIDSNYKFNLYIHILYLVMLQMSLLCNYHAFNLLSYRYIILAKMIRINYATKIT
jgi:hypothetical protein